MDILLLFEDLTTLLLSQDQIDAIVHHELFLQYLFDLVHVLYRVKINGHLELLIVPAFN